MKNLDWVKFEKYLIAHRELLIRFGYTEAISTYMSGDDTVTGDVELTIHGFGIHL